MLTYLTVERKAILLCERRMLQVPRCTHMTGFSDPPRGKLKQASPQQSRWPRESDLLSLELMAQYGCSALGVSRHRTQNVGFIPAELHGTVSNTGSPRGSWFPLAQCSYACLSGPLANFMLCGHSLEVLNNFLTMSLTFAIGPYTVDMGRISS